MSEASQVSVALIWRAATLLVAKRPERALEGGRWEFPGGKVEAGESARQALVRECQEELGVRVICLGLAWTTRIERQRGPLCLSFFHARLAPGAVPAPLAANALAWMEVEALLTLPFCSGDAELLQALCDRRVLPPPL